MKRCLLPILGGSLLLLSACGTEDAGPGTISTTAPMEAKYSTTDGIIPFPNNILFSGTADATLNITSGVTDPTDITNPTVALNTLDGFSTVAPITTTFGLPIDVASIDKYSVRVFPVTSADPTAAVVQPPAAYATTGLAGAELVFGVDFKALPSPANPNVLVIKPVKALLSNTNYMVIVTNALKSTSGEAARPSALFTLLKNTSALVDATGASQIPGRDDATATQLEGLRQLTQAMLAIGNAVGIAPADVAVAWSFKTQTLGKVLAKIQADSATDPYATNPASFITAGSASLGAFPFVPFAQGLAAGGNTGLLDAYTANPTGFDTIGSVVIGEVKLPYYLDVAANANDPAPLTSTFQVDSYSSPTLKSVQTVPFLMTIPNKAPAAGKWPVVIFQHGFTVDKSVVFGIANSLSKAGFAVIAIDAVLHGDRTFGLDFFNNTTGGLGRDGVADTSGKHYLNLTSLLTSRDNIRQSVADLIHLTRLLEVQTMDVVNNGTGLPGADGTPDLIVGAAPVSYVGHSNGGILGTVLAGVEPAIQTFVLVNPGGDYGSILQNSGAFSPVVNAGLSAKGVTVGSAQYNSYFVAAQTIVDDGDPLNYATAASAKNILLMKTLNDNVVPNKQTDNLSIALNLPQVAAIPASAVWPAALGVQNGNATPNLPPALPTGGFTGSGFTFFTQGTHSSILKPDPAGVIGDDVIFEMQSEVLYFLASALQPVTATIYIGGAGSLPSTNAASSVVQ